MSALATKAMLVAVNRSVWTASRKDAEITREVAVRHSANSTKAGRYTKFLIDPDAAELKKVRDIAGRLYAHHMKVTRAWSDDGYRVLPSELYYEYTNTMRVMTDEFEAAVEELIAAFPKLQANAKQELNGMYCDDDYPSEAELRRKFGIRVRVLPMPAAQDFRCDIADAEVARIREQIADEEREALAGGTRELFDRLHSVVSKLYETLDQPEKIFRDSLLTNIDEVTKLLPKLNITQDADLDQLVSEVRAKFADLKPQQLRDDKMRRKLVATEAASIAKKMSAFMGAA